MNGLQQAAADEELSRLQAEVAKLLAELAAKDAEVAGANALPPKSTDDAAAKEPPATTDASVSKELAEAMVPLLLGGLLGLREFAGWGGSKS